MIKSIAIIRFKVFLNPSTKQLLIDNIVLLIIAINIITMQTSYHIITCRELNY